VKAYGRDLTDFLRHMRVRSVKAILDKTSEPSTS